MAEKEKPYTLVDTHAGAGGYSIEGKYAQKKGEYVYGVSRLWDAKDLPEPLARYMEQVRLFNPDGQLRQYPGSPAIANLLMRDEDRLRVYELHPRLPHPRDLPRHALRTPRSATRTASARCAPSCRRPRAARWC